MSSKSSGRCSCSRSTAAASGSRRRRPSSARRRPETLGATTVRLSLHVDDADAAAERAVAAGATLLFPVEDQPYGLRQGRVVDPFGHHWLIAQ